MGSERGGGQRSKSSAPEILAQCCFERTLTMHHRNFVSIIVCTAFVLIISIGSLGADTGEAAAQQEDKPVEQVNKNILVLKGMPSSQLLPVMHFMRTSLGVRCDYCHVAENDKYWMDDK